MANVEQLRGRCKNFSEADESTIPQNSFCRYYGFTVPPEKPLACELIAKGGADTKCTLIPGNIVAIKDSLRTDFLDSLTASKVKPGEIIVGGAILTINDLPQQPSVKKNRQQSLVKRPYTEARRLGRMRLSQERNDHATIPPDAKGVMLGEHGWTLFPIENAAFFLGALAAGGSSSYDIAGITFWGGSDELLDKIASVGKGIFGFPSERRHLGTSVRGKPLQEEHFSGLLFYNIVGHFGRADWPETIMKRHSWIEKDPELIKAFLKGFYEFNGFASIRKNKGKGNYRIELNTNNPDGVALLRHMLSRSNIKSGERRSKNRLYGVYISNIDDVRGFANIVHSVQPDKESVLETFRRIKREVVSSVTVRELIQAYVATVASLHRIPSWTELEYRKERKKYPYALDSYRNHINKSLRKVSIILATILYEVGLTDAQGGIKPNTRPKDLSTSSLFRDINRGWHIRQLEKSQAKAVANGNSSEANKITNEIKRIRTFQSLSNRQIVADYLRVNAGRFVDDRKAFRLGRLALANACLTYDYQSGVDFKTYAQACVSDELNKYASDSVPRDIFP